MSQHVFSLYVIKQVMEEYGIPHKTKSILQLIMYYTPKKVLPLALFFKTYQVFKNREGIVSPTNLAE